MSDAPRPMSLLGRAVPTILRLRGANKNYRSRDHVRRHLDALVVRPRPVAAPSKTRKNVTIEATRERGWRIFTILPTHNKPRGTILYLHGGGWIHEASSAHWRLAQQLADEAQTCVVMPVYPLAHEDGTAASVVPFVAELAMRATQPVVLMGDSAGGTIAISAALALNARRIRVPLTVLISPALDMRMDNPDIDRVQPHDPWLVKSGQLELVEMWIDGAVDDPILNPMMGDLAGLGELLILSGTRDILNPDTRLFVDKARAADVQVAYHEQTGHVHVYPLLPTPEAKDARDLIVRSVRTVLARED